MKTNHNKFLVRSALGLLLTILHLQLLTAHAAPGDLDTTFNGTGKIRFGFAGGFALGLALAVQNDGKLVMAGGSYSIGYSNEFFVVMRFDTNNVLDPTFGGDGMVLTPFGSYSRAYATAVGVQADGKIVAAGTGGYPGYFALARYNPNGSLDSTFGTGGEVVTDFGELAEITAMKIQPDGKIVVAGNVGSPGFATMARYDTNGVLDPSFGSGGVSDTVSNVFAEAMTLDSEGRIVTVGEAITNLAVVRFATNGVLDTTFGGTGMVVSTITGYDHGVAYAVAIQPSTPTTTEKIVVAGDITSGSPVIPDFAVVRYNLDGSLDTSFGNEGVISGSFGPGNSYATGLAVQVLRQGLTFRPAITLGGYEKESSGTYDTYFALARFNGDGSLNTAFGTNGTGKSTELLSTGLNGGVAAMGYQAGKFVLGGSILGFFAAARFNSDGSADTSFGNNGKILAGTDFYSHAQAVAIQSNGKLVVAGGADNVMQYGSGFAIGRFNPDGLLDESFGPGGRITTFLGSDAAANTVAIQPDGEIVAAGYALEGLHDEFAVVRYVSNGTPDVSFNTTGAVVTAIGGSNDLANAVAVQTDGRIVAAGQSFNGANNDFALVRYSTTGTLDPSFGTGGKVTTDINGGDDAIKAVLIQPDSKIVAAGYAEVGPTTNFALVRYNPDGSLDNLFGSFGKVTTDFGTGGPAYGYAMTIQPDGRILVAGDNVIDGNDYIAVARYETNGALDGAFGTGGKVSLQVGQYATGVAMQSDGKILVGGIPRLVTSEEYVVLRLNSNGSLDTSYGTAGETVISFDDGGPDTGYAIAVDQIGRAVVVGNANNLFGVARLASEPFLRIASINYLANGQVALQGLGVPDATNTLEATGSLGPGYFSPFDSVMPDAGGFWQYQDTNAPVVSSRFYRLSYP